MSRLAKLAGVAAVVTLVVEIFYVTSFLSRGRENPKWAPAEAAKAAPAAALAAAPAEPEPAWRCEGQTWPNISPGCIAALEGSAPKNVRVIGGPESERVRSSSAALTAPEPPPKPAFDPPATGTLPKKPEKPALAAAPAAPKPEPVVTASAPKAIFVPGELMVKPDGSEVAPPASTRQPETQPAAAEVAPAEAAKPAASPAAPSRRDAKRKARHSQRIAHAPGSRYDGGSPFWGQPAASSWRAPAAASASRMPATASRRDPVQFGLAERGN